MRSINQRGSVLISFIVAIVLIAVLGAGIYTLTSSSSFGELLTGNDYNAYQLAKSGMRFAVDQLAFNSGYTGGTYSMPDANNTFTVAVANNIITVTGTTNQGLVNFVTASRTLVYNANWLSTVYNFGPSMNDPNNGQSTTGGDQTKAIVVDIAGQTATLGGNVKDSYGTLLFKGSGNNGNCINGACDFSSGIRAFFNFTFTSEDTDTNSIGGADGFTFAVISAFNNTSDRTGGAPSGYSMGELMGYAGPGTTVDKLGLKPPKIALSFDTYPNGTNGICSSGSRNDPSPFYNNVTFMYWGAKSPTPATCTYGGTSYPTDSFDDNVHGAGGSGDPQNPAGVDYPSSKMTRTCKSGSGTCNFMEDGYNYSARIEIIPTTTPYTYQLKAWIVLKNDPSIFTTPTWWSDFQNVMLPYGDTTAQISKTVTLSAADYNNFQKIYFGFTEGTGAATQLITLDSLNVFFPPPATAHETQTIGPITLTPGTLNVGGTTTASATATSGLPVTFTSLTTGICTVSGTNGSTITGKVEGTCTIAANQAGDAYYYAATEVTGDITVTCPGYRVWNTTGNTWDFMVTGNACQSNIATNSQITTTTVSTQLKSGGAVSRYTTAGSGCSSAVQGSISYTQAVNADTNHDCRVNYNSGDTVGDR